MTTKELLHLLKPVAEKVMLAAETEPGNASIQSANVIILAFVLCLLLDAEKKNNQGLVMLALVAGMVEKQVES